MTFQEKGYEIQAKLERDRNALLPSWYQEEPIPDDATRFLIDAFWGLSTERQIGMVLGHIPESAIVACAARKGVSDAMLRLFTAVIRSLDSEYLQWSAKRAKKARGGQ